MKLTRLAPGVIGSNCYILIDGKNAAVIDPGVPAADIMRVINSSDAKLGSILLTHAHFDHMLGLDRLREANPDVPVILHADDAELMSDGHKNAFFDFFGRDRDFGKPDKLLIDGDVIMIGSEQLHVIHTPGHTKGSACYRYKNLLFSGDTIMAESYGRCDLYSGNSQKMNSSLLKLARLSESNPSITIYPGHGDFTSLTSAIHNIYNN